MDGINNATTFTDSSPSAHGVTAVNDARISTATKKFGTGALSLDGSQDRLSIADSSDFDFGTSDFTVDFWIYPTGAQNINQHIFTQSNASIDTYVSLQIFGAQTGDLSFLAATAGVAQIFLYTSDNNVLTLNQWNHVAVVRNVNNWYIFVNGVSKLLVLYYGSYSATIPNVSGELTIGARFDGANGTFGFIDEFRISKGVARYTSNFAVPTIPYS